jgi:hypothetical protein
MAILHCIENILLIWPALLCSYRAVLRYSQLPQLPEEASLLGLYYTVLVAVPVLFILSTLGQIWLFEVYNMKGHPWSMLLQASQRQNKTVSTDKPTLS